MQEVVLFLMCFILILIIYELFVVRKALKRKKKNILDKQPMEVRYLIYKYKFDLEKIKYSRLLQVVAFVSSFDISIIVTIAFIFDSYLIQLLVGLVLVVPVILISYHLVYLVYKKRGLI